MSALPAAIDALRHACSLATPAPRARIISTGLTDLDNALPGRGLTCAGIHEWFGLSDPDQVSQHRVPRHPVSDSARVPRHSVAGSDGSPQHSMTDSDRVPRHSVAGSSWSPPLTILSLLATRALAALDDSTHTPASCLIWIGRAVWPYAPTLPRPALDRSLFIHAPRPADRLWAADLALRSRVAAAVVLDASTFDLPSTRRLQLAAESASASKEVGGLCLLARPPWERSTLSAATTRWNICRAVSPHHARRWSVELLRCKGVRPTDHVHAQTRAWTLEHSHASRALALVSDTLDGPRPSQVEAA
ncbi:MAG TPA: hypothetical protein PKE29_10570 [Phycisphaerales bacterium]|nr:hypothetical protein [Phycisphaerales bacterium]